ncbi:TPA: hypothetical protein GFX74_19255 [Escherichia coli]|nr:hypothetical protein [Escherichia coli]
MPMYIKLIISIVRRINMNTICSLIVVVALSLLSFSSLAKTITAVGSTINSTEKNFFTGRKQGKSYKILGAFFKNRVYMIAKLTPVSKNDAS